MTLSKIKNQGNDFSSRINDQQIQDIMFFGDQRVWNTTYLPHPPKLGGSIKAQNWQFLTMQTFPQILVFARSWLITIENSLSLNIVLLFKLFMKFLATLHMSSLFAFKSLLPTIQEFSSVLKSLAKQSSPIYPQFWQLQSFHITKEQTLLSNLKPLYHIQCSLKAQPQTTVSLEAIVFTVMTFHAGCQRVLRWSERSELNLAQFDELKAVKALELIKLQMSVRLEELMLPQPCQSTVCVLAMRERRIVAKSSLLFI